MAKNIEDTRERLKTLTWSNDRVGAFLWKTISRTLCYAAERIPEIADTVVEVDRAMRWGFNWELGPFEVWDAIGVEKSVAKLKEEGRPVPANVQSMLDAGVKSFYKKKDGQQFFYDFASEEYRPLADQPGTIILKSLKDRIDVIKKNSGASLIDLGDGVPFDSFKDEFDWRHTSRCSRLRNEVENFVGLVVANQGQTSQSAPI
jgi:3-hydroxyacyl-CoA dehydrogenase